MVEEYLKQMSPKERIAYEIAKKKLGSSFNIKKSIGYITYLKNKSFGLCFFFLEKQLSI